MKINDGIKYVYYFSNPKDKEFIIVNRKDLSEYYEELNEKEVLFSDVMKKITKDKFVYDEDESIILTAKTVDLLDNKILFHDKNLSKKQFGNLLDKSSMDIEDLIKKGEEPNRAIIRQDEAGNIVEMAVLFPYNEKYKAPNMDKVPEFMFDYQQLLSKDPLWKDVKSVKVMQTEKGEFILVGKNPFEENENIIFKGGYLKERFGDFTKQLEPVSAKSITKEKEEETEVAR